MDEHPDYFPASWSQLPGWRWIAAKPSRVLVWYATGVPVFIALIIMGATSGSAFFLGCALVACAAFALHAAIYVPRAWQAMHGRTDDSN
jgi:hypothetical protein